MFCFLKRNSLLTPLVVISTSLWQIVMGKVGLLFLQKCAPDDDELGPRQKTLNVPF